MDYPTEAKLFAAIDATCAPYSIQIHQGWTIREGAGGGKRVSAATLVSKSKNASINSATSIMLSLDQESLFMLRGSDTQLDDELKTRGYSLIDPVVILAASIESLHNNKTSDSYVIDKLISPTKIAKTIWTKGGIGPARLDIMARVKTPKTILIVEDMGVAFVATHNGIAMIHAVEVAKAHRRKGVANALMHHAIEWAKEQGCAWVSVLTVPENIPAIALYENLGMKKAATYHYRLLT